MSADLARAWELARHQRWFSGHSRAAEPLAVEIGDPVSDARWAPRSMFLDVGYPDSSTERYHLPVIAGAGEAWVDACDVPEAMLALIDALDAQAPGLVRFGDLPPVSTPRKYGGEQSNTSVFFGEMLLKVFRRLEEGRNLDVEIHQALSGTGLVAQIYGVWRSGETDLGVFLEALKQPEDGFLLARDHADNGRDFSEHARALGASLSAVHRGLARAFPTAEGSRADLRAEFISHFEAGAAEVPELRSSRDAVGRVLDEIGDGRFPAQRVHGDCHLGQVLLSEGAWRWVDFEGEPLKSLEERRRPDSPLRDIAGMLRSFGYAAAGAREAGWETACREAFLDGYGLTGDVDTKLLRAYEIDKAVYEVIYEARNRPSWIQIPLRALG